jgi:hypothetical protein
VAGQRSGNTAYKSMPVLRSVPDLNCVRLFDTTTATATRRVRFVRRQRGIAECHSRLEIERSIPDVPSRLVEGPDRLLDTTTAAMT